MGISAEKICRIFEPFFTTKEVGKGTGLGLAMVHGFVEEHNGVIDVDSKLGIGTTFRIHLPAATGDQSAPVEVDTAAPYTSGGSETLLIADDEPLVRGVAERILRRAGYNVLTAENGEEAVAMFNVHREEIALTLLDVMMPRLTGREAFEQIRQIDADAPAIFCTGYDPETSQTESFHHDNLSVITKPFHQEELLRTVRQRLDASATSEIQSTRTPIKSVQIAQC
jgi:two-component system, cell cycle sensor histidine kinase and response regulator CckA